MVDEATETHDEAALTEGGEVLICVGILADTADGINVGERDGVEVLFSPLMLAMIS